MVVCELREFIEIQDDVDGRCKEIQRREQQDEVQQDPTHDVTINSIHSVSAVRVFASQWQ